MINIIICYTPLQTLIAEKIIDLHPNEKFYGIVLTPINTPKNKYYFERLKKKCVKCVYIQNIYFKQIENINHFSFFFKILILIYKWKFNKKCSFFIASIDLYLIHCLLSFIKPQEIYTFDDGTVNIIKSGLYQNSFKKFRLRGRIFNRFLGISYDIERIKKESKLHYTIYPSMKNIISRIRPISIIGDQINTPTKKENISILIGQPFCKNIKTLTENIIKKYNITHYIPHPFEDQYIENVDYINTPLIFEDYFAQNLLDKNVTLYTFFSSAALNIASLPNVKVISIKPKNITNNSFLECYEIFRQMNIEVIDYSDDI